MNRQALIDYLNATIASTGRQSDYGNGVCDALGTLHLLIDTGAFDEITSNGDVRRERSRDRHSLRLVRG